MLFTVDPVIPLSVLISRLEKHRDATQATLDATSQWRSKRRAMLAGIVAAYQYEIDAALALAGSCQPIIRDYLSIKRDK